LFGLLFAVLYSRRAHVAVFTWMAMVLSLSLVETRMSAVGLPPRVRATTNPIAAKRAATKCSPAAPVIAVACRGMAYLLG
jgi:hypothetical protein